MVVVEGRSGIGLLEYGGGRGLLGYRGGIGSLGVVGGYRALLSSRQITYLMVMCAHAWCTEFTNYTYSNKLVVQGLQWE